MNSQGIFESCTIFPRASQPCWTLLSKLTCGRGWKILQRHQHSKPAEKEAKALSIFIFRPRDTYFNFTLFLFEGGPDWKNQKPVELRTKPAHSSAFSFPSLTVSSTDFASALTGPTSSENSYKTPKWKRLCLPGGIFFPQVLTDLIFTTCEQVFAVLKMCWVIAHARHLPFSAPSVFKAFFFCENTPVNNGAVAFSSHLSGYCFVVKYNW